MSRHKGYTYRVPAVSVMVTVLSSSETQGRLKDYPTYSLMDYQTHHHQSVLHKGRTFTANSGTKTAVLPKGRSSTANSGTKVAV